VATTAAGFNRRHASDVPGIPTAKVTQMPKNAPHAKEQSMLLMSALATSRRKFDRFRLTPRIVQAAENCKVERDLS